MAQYKNKKKREKRKLRQELANKRRDALQTKPIAGDVPEYYRKYIHSLNPRDKRHQQYVFQIVARESTEAQRKNLIPQLDRMHCYLDVFGFQERIMPKDFRVVASVLQSDEFELELSEKFKLIDKSQYGWLADIAGRMLPLETYFPDMKFALLFESTCRVVRPDDYTKENKDAIITEQKLKQVAEIAHFPIFTICPANLTQAEIQSYRKKFDFILKEHRELLKRQPGDLKREKDEKQDEVIRLEIENKKTHREISEETGIPLPRVCSWWRKDPQYFPKS